MRRPTIRPESVPAPGKATVQSTPVLRLRLSRLHLEDNSAFHTYGQVAVQVLFRRLGLRLR